MKIDNVYLILLFVYNNNIRLWIMQTLYLFKYISKCCSLIIGLGNIMMMIPFPFEHFQIHTRRNVLMCI